MIPTLNEVITWLIVGTVAGSLTGMLVTRTKQGFGRAINFGVGLVGALIGGFLFKILEINLGLLAEVHMSLQDLVAALSGSLLFLLIVWAVRGYRARRKA